VYWPMARDDLHEKFREFPPVAMLNRVAEWIADAAMFVSCIVLLWLVGLTCVDVIGRYFFRAPVTGAAELVQISMAGIIFFALPAMFLRDDQVIVDLFSVVRRGWFGWVVSLAFAVTTVIAVYIVAARVSGYALRAWEDGDVSIYLKIPTYLVVYAITILIHLSCIFAAVRAVRIMFSPGRLLPGVSGQPEARE
jgi:TRAP-type C4-dicarboxylate transport system permease small subunit